MPAPIPFNPDRFAGAAEDYLAGRPAYAEALVPRVAQLAGLEATDRVMDLGCGPAQLARAFAPLCAEVLAIDPEPGMLAAARQQVASVRSRILFRQGSSYDLSPEMGRFRVAAIGRAFHWMDRPDTLMRLDALLDPGGAVVLFHSRLPGLPENRWSQAFDSVLEQFADGAGTRKALRGPDWVPHESILLDSPFACLETISITERRLTATAALIRRALSMSSTSRARVGDRIDAMLEALTAVLTPFETDGMVAEVVDSVGLIARRP